MSNKKTQKGDRKSLLTGASVLAAATAMFTGAPVLVSEAQAQDDESIVVTGSRLARQDYQASSPLHTVTGEQLQEIGAGTIETYLNSLPQLSPSLTRTNNNPVGGGAAFIDMRQLGTARGLVLLDGRRVVPGAANGAVNLSVIPGAMIERVEVITGGASATYGADAVAGVVNFITRRDFEGLEIGGQYGMTQEYTDGNEGLLNIVAGGSFAGGRGHMMFGAAYTDRASIGQADRPWTQSSQFCLTTGCRLSGSTNTGSGTFSVSAAQAANAGFVAYFTGLGVPANAIFTGQRVGFNSDGSMFVAGTGGALNANDRMWLFDGGYPAAGNYDPNLYYGHNFNPENLLTSPFERYSFFTNFRYDLTDAVEAYGSALFSQYNAENALASSPSQFLVNSNSFAVNNFVQPAAAAAIQGVNPAGYNFALARRTVEFGPRLFVERTEAWELLGGLRGSLPGIGDREWDWDIFTSFGRYHNSEDNRGYPHLVRINAALNAAGCLGGPPLAPGQPAPPLGPVGPAGSPTSCVPFNPFGFGNITQPQIDYIEAKAQFREIDIEQRNTVASINGDLFDLWAGPVQFALGGEYRSIEFSNIPGEAQQTGALLGANSAGPVRGTFDVFELFAETRVPLLRDLPLVHSLAVEGGYRWSDYSIAGGGSFDTDTWRAAIEWEPVSWLRFRAQEQQAIRSPSVGELFLTRAQGFPQVTAGNIDPCNFNSAQRTGANAVQVQALCAAQNANAGGAAFLGAIAGQQYRTVSGGNPNLQPEDSISRTMGLVISAPSAAPSALQSFRMTVDYWDIEIENVISAVGFATSLSRCYDPAFNPGFAVGNAFCQNINRDPATGFLTSLGIDGFISQTNANLATFLASGVDLGASMRLDFLPENWGSFDVSTVLTYYENQQFRSLPGNPLSNSFVGTIGSGAPGATALPEWKAVTRFGWQNGPFSASLRWQYIDDIIDPAATPGNLLIPGIDAYNYFYLNANWDITDNVRWTFGVDNLTDEPAPIYTSGFQYNTDPSTYDVLGRFVYTGFRVRF